MRVARLIPVLFALLTAQAQAGDRVGLPSLVIPISVRQMGMGEVGMGGSDILRSWANPALLADQQTVGEAAVGGQSLFAGDQSGVDLGLGWKPKYWLATGLLVSYNSLSVPEVGTAGAATSKTFGQSTYSAGLLGAISTAWMNAGIAVKMVGESVDSVSAGGIALDAGVTAGPPICKVGVSARNLGPSVWKSGGADPVEESLPFEIRAGAATRIWKIGAGAEYAMPTGRKGNLMAGLEYWVIDLLALRAGVAGVGDTGGTRVTAGLTGLFRGIGLDYAMGTHELGLSHRIAVSYAFGGVPPARPVVVREPEPEPEPKPAEEDKASGEAVKAPEEPGKPAAGAINVAVLDLAAQGVSASDASVITDMLRGALVKTGKVAMIEKQNMDKVLAEQAFQQTGCTSEECAIKMGKLLNVQRMIVGSFGKLLDKYIVNIRVVNVETGKIVYADSAGGKSVEVLEKEMVTLADRISRRAR